jgi:hypothetical protein
MVQAARSGRQNIAEGSRASAASSQTELRLVNVARSSLEELLLDYEDFLRHRRLKQCCRRLNSSVPAVRPTHGVAHSSQRQEGRLAVLKLLRLPRLQRGRAVVTGFRHRSPHSVAGAVYWRSGWA